MKAGEWKEGGGGAVLLPLLTASFFLVRHACVKKGKNDGRRRSKKQYLVINALTRTQMLASTVVSCRALFMKPHISLNSTSPPLLPPSSLSTPTQHVHAIPQKTYQTQGQSHGL